MNRRRPFLGPLWFFDDIVTGGDRFFRVVESELGLSEWEEDGEEEVVDDNDVGGFF